MKCRQYRFMLSRRLDGDLDERESAALADHLRGCPGCQARDKDYQRIRAEIKHIDSGSGPMKSPSRLRIPDSSSQRRRVWKRSFVWATGLAVVVLIGILLSIRSDPLGRLAERNPIVYEPMRTLISVMNGQVQSSGAASSEPYHPMRHYITRVESGAQINRFYLSEGTVPDLVPDR